jgi:ABC-type polysaccharide/polyol phosphate export permease
MTKNITLLFENILVWGFVRWSFVAKASAVAAALLPLLQIVALLAALTLSILSIRKLLKENKK